MKLHVSVLVLSCVALPARVASADRQSTAAALFEQGIKDLQAGNTAAACKELADSVAAWPDSGAKGALAECNTALGRTGSAWELWKDLATSAPTAELRNDAAANAAKLEPRLARAQFHIRGSAPADLVVKLNGKRVSAQSTTPIAVDPGALVVDATGSGLAPWSHTYTAAEATTTEIAISLDELRGSDPDRARRSRHVLGMSIGGGGVALLATGAVLGLIARADWERARDACMGNTGQCPTSAVLKAQQDHDSAQKAALLSEIAFGAGAAAVAAGLVIYFTAPAPAERAQAAWRLSPMTAPGTIGLTLSGAL
jgi:hypothetical protein